MNFETVTRLVSFEDIFFSDSFDKSPSLLTESSIEIEDGNRQHHLTTDEERKSVSNQKSSVYYSRTPRNNELDWIVRCALCWTAPLPIFSTRKKEKMFPLIIRTENGTIATHDTDEDTEEIDCGEVKKSSIPVRILPYLYLGSRLQTTSEICQILGITHMLNLMNNPQTPQNNNTLEMLHEPLSDNGSSNIKDLSSKLFTFVDQARLSRDQKPHGKILLHCENGFNRSATIAIAYIMMRSEKISLNEAYNHVKSCCPTITIRSKYFEQLQQLEQDKYSSISMELNNTFSSKSIDEAVNSEEMTEK
eukprot:gene4425-6258_t